MPITVFKPIFDRFDTAVNNTLASGSANIISLITPLMLTCFSIYVGLIAISYLNGKTEIPVGDTAKRMMGWMTVIAFGLNIETYSSTVVPFLQEFGNDLAQAITNNTTSADALDTLLNAYIDAIGSLFKGINPWDVGLLLEAISFSMLIILSATAFMAIAAAYIILAKFALGVLLALGPMFIAAALFPASRQFFEAWLGQCLNYGFLVVLFAAVGAIEVEYATSAIPKGGFSVSQYAGYVGGAIMMAMMAVVFVVISLNMPSLASQLAGGIGISSMVGKLAAAARGASKAMQFMSQRSSSSDRSSGSISAEREGE